MLWVIGLSGAFTALYAASCGIAQVDIKRVLAYSTISQLGYMFLGVGIGAPSLGLFHLLVHACYKALLFMGAGVVILIYSDNHDIRQMGGLKKQQPLLLPVLSHKKWRLRLSLQQLSLINFLIPI